MSSIVYIATNLVNGKRYIGATSRGLAQRKLDHLHGSRTRRVTCRYFHAAIRKHGFDAFGWMVLATCETFDLALAEEVRLISEIRPEYNLTVGGQGSKGRVVTQEQRERHGLAMRGRKKSRESVERGAAKMRGQKRTLEQRERMGAARRGKPFSAMHIANIALAATGKKQSAETIEKRRKAWLGKSLSLEHREKIRASLTGRPRPPEVVARMLESRRKTFEARRAEASQ